MSFLENSKKILTAAGVAATVIASEVEAQTPEILRAQATLDSLVAEQARTDSVAAIQRTPEQIFLEAYHSADSDSNFTATVDSSGMTLTLEDIPNGTLSDVVNSTNITDKQEIADLYEQSTNVKLDPNFLNVYKDNEGNITDIRNSKTRARAVADTFSLAALDTLEFDYEILTKDADGNDVPLDKVAIRTALSKEGGKKFIEGVVTEYLDINGNVIPSRHFGKDGHVNIGRGYKVTVPGNKLNNELASLYPGLTEEPITGQTSTAPQRNETVVEAQVVQTQAEADSVRDERARLQRKARQEEARERIRSYTDDNSVSLSLGTTFSNDGVIPNGRLSLKVTDNYWVGLNGGLWYKSNVTHFPTTADNITDRITSQTSKSETEKLLWGNLGFLIGKEVNDKASVYAGIGAQVRALTLTQKNRETLYKDGLVTEDNGGVEATLIDKLNVDPSIKVGTEFGGDNLRAFVELGYTHNKDLIPKKRLVGGIGFTYRK
ncbi:hypothetical protein CL617_03120 [archaeon]|nr:hypothetical protein [archaeon]|tara:strand:+ start:27657 stop:29129 length:1473 start_codon:yes stop_codon:yes gene_type:complete